MRQPFAASPVTFSSAFLRSITGLSRASIAANEKIVCWPASVDAQTKKPNCLACYEFESS
jgi:hypothetical protein